MNCHEFQNRIIDLLDGRNFTDICSEEYEPLAGNTSTIRTHKYAFEPVKTRYVRFTVDTETDMPTWHAGAGNPSFFFCR